jgi:hypothetical protein
MGSVVLMVRGCRKPRELSRNFAHAAGGIMSQRYVYGDIDVGR